MARIRRYLAMCHRIATKLVRHDLPGLIAMRPQQPFKKVFRSKSISPGLQKNINHLTILINCPPQIVLLAVYLHKDLVDVESVTESSMSLLQSTCVFGSKLDAPEADRFPSDYDPTLSQEIFDIPV